MCILNESSQKFFEQLKEEVSDKEIVLQVDFAENFNLKEQD